MKTAFEKLESPFLDGESAFEFSPVALAFDETPFLNPADEAPNLFHLRHRAEEAKDEARIDAGDNETRHGIEDWLAMAEEDSDTPGSPSV